MLKSITRNEVLSHDFTGRKLCRCFLKLRQEFRTAVGRSGFRLHSLKEVFFDRRLDHEGREGVNGFKIPQTLRIPSLSVSECQDPSRDGMYCACPIPTEWYSRRASEPERSPPTTIGTEKSGYRLVACREQHPSPQSEFMANVRKSVNGLFLLTWSLYVHRVTRIAREACD